MIESFIRSRYQSLLVDPLALYLQRNQCLSANRITLIAMMSGCLASAFVIQAYPLLAVASLLISGYCDTLDGTLARFQNNSTPFGTVLDIVVDRAVELMVIYALYRLDPTIRADGAILMLGSILLCVTSFLVVGIFSDNHSDKSFYYSPGLMERPEAFAFFIAMILFPHGFQFLAYSFSLLVFTTALIRVWQFYRQCEYN